jgi:hypothetical protein
MCDCKSYNRPDWGGTNEEVLIYNPFDSRMIPVDPCIAETIRALWDAGVVTCACCCGHNQGPPSVVLEDTGQGALAREVISRVDARPWKIMVWKLVEI